MTTKPAPTTGPKKWYIANWTGLGWLETGVKFLAHILALIAFARAVQTGAPASLEGAGVIQAVVLGLLALGLVGAIADRFMEKEIIAMGFVFINVVAHWMMFYTLFREPGPGVLLSGFAGLMLLGDLIKIVFLVRTKFTVRGYDPRLLVYLTGSVVIMEAVLFVVSLIKT